MARMIDLIRKGAAPPSMIRRAAEGGLSLPDGEAIEILVALAGHPELGTVAGQTLAGWDESALASVASSAQTPAEVLVHLLHQKNVPPAVLTAVCNNPSAPEAELEKLAAQAGVAVLRGMASSDRVLGSPRLLDLISANPAATTIMEQLRRWESSHDEADDGEVERAGAEYIAAHAEEVKREEHQPFQLTAGGEDSGEDPMVKLLERMKTGATAEADAEESVQLSLLQRIAKMRVSERIKLAMRGNREERMVLIRDRSKLVSLAVLDSPKVNDSEMESFAAMKNVQETVLRGIAGKRKCMKNYSVLRALVNNPKLPIDAALPLVSHLTAKDQRALGVNKNVNETVRKLALKFYRAKIETRRD